MVDSYLVTEMRMWWRNPSLEQRVTMLLLHGEQEMALAGVLCLLFELHRTGFIGNRDFYKHLDILQTTEDDGKLLVFKYKKDFAPYL